MRLQDNIDFTTLAWVKPELDETLRQAQRALEEYVDGLGTGVADATQLRLVAAHLHQVQGTLRMVELYGAAMVAEEMEQLVLALQQDGAESRDAGYSALMRGMMQLPDYLERLQGGHRDIPMVLLPLLNELRDARGAQPLPESVLFSPDLRRELPDTARGPASPLPDAPRRVQVEALRGRFQAALLQWLREGDNPDNIAALTEICEQLVRITQSEDARRLFWVAAGTLQALRAGAFDASRDLKQALGRLEREIKRLGEGGDGAFRNAPPLELTRQLLYFVAHAPADHVRIHEIRDVFGLDGYLPSDAEMDHARGSLAGHNRALLDTVSSALKDDLLRVKDALDLHLRVEGLAPAELEPQLAVLDRVGDTLGMLGLSVSRRVVQEQRQAIAGLVGSGREAGEGVLLDVAGALLYVEATLDDQVAQLGARQTEQTASSAEARRVLESLVKEAIANFTHARQCFVAFVETNWDHDRLREVPRLLDEVVGALRIVEVPLAPDYLAAIRQFTQVELLQRRRVPNARQIDTLADALAGIEYFLEALRDQRSGRERILEVPRQSLERLGYWPPPAPGLSDGDAVEPDAGADAHPEADTDVAPEAETMDGPAPYGPPATDPTAAWIEHEKAAAGTEDHAVAETASADGAYDPAPEAPAGATPPAPPLPPRDDGESGMLFPGFEGDSDDIDEEIREVFLEEMQEEIDNLGRMLPAWSGNTGNLDQLRGIRRVFHTLKGSGRLVGATTLGEFSWKVENMLNRVLDGSRTPSDAVRELVERALHTLPQLLAALRGERVWLPQLAELRDVADRLAAGEEARLSPAQPGRTGPMPATDAGHAWPDADTDPGSLQAAPASGAAGHPAQTGESGSAPESPAGWDDAAARPAPGVPASVDPVLLEILRTEVAGHLATVDAWLATGGGAADDPLLRAVHTTNGAFAMTDVPLITEVLGPLEAYIKRLLGNAREADEAGVALVRDSVAAVRATMAGLDAEQPHVPDVGDLPLRAAALRDSLPVPPGPSLQMTLDDESEFDLAPGTDIGLPGVVEIDPPDTSALPESLDHAGATEEAAEEAGSGGGTEEMSPLATGDVPHSPQPEHAAAGEELEAGFDIDAGQASGPGLDPRSGPEADPAQEGGADGAAPPEPAGEQPEPGVERPADAPVFEFDAHSGPEAASDAGAVEASGTDDASAPESERVVAGDDLEAGSDIDAGLEPVEADASSGSEADLHAGLAGDGGADDASAPAPERIVAGEEPESAFHADPVEHEVFEFEVAPEPETGPGAGPVGDDPGAPEPGDVPASGSEASDGPDPFADALAAAGLPSGEHDAEIAALVQAMLDHELARLAAGASPDLPAVDDDAWPMPSVPAGETGEAADESAAASDEPAARGIDDDAYDAGGREAGEAADAVSEGDAVRPEDADADTGISADGEVASGASPEDGDASGAGAPEDDEGGRVAADGDAPAPDDGAAATATVDPDAALDPEGVDAELLDIFLEEASDLLDHCDGMLATLRATPTDREAVIGLQRDLHTLKGGARMAGLHAVGELGHSMETLLEAVSEGRRDLDAQGVGLLERCFDRLQVMVERLGARRAVAFPQALIAELEASAGPDAEARTGLGADLAAPEGLDRPHRPREPASQATVATGPADEGDAGYAGAAGDEAERADARSGEQAAAGPVELPPLSPPIEELAEEADGAIRAPQEQVRIRAELLDRLVNYAGEVAIYRARLEQQLGAFRGNLNELEQTTGRLREQLRRLEIETEAQIASRYQREHETGDPAFDPLELDRFSTQQQLTRGLAETAADLTSLQGVLDEHTRQYETLLVQQARVSSELQEGLMRTRMVPFDSLVPRLRRVLRQAAADAGREVQLRVDGAGGEMDRNVLEHMTAPLEHMLRNAVAHGIEAPEVREAAGKPREGTVRIAVAREGSEVMLTLSDDGRGLDREAIRAKAVERGLLAGDAEVRDADLYGFTLATGFSTAGEVTRLAGRGVGMDVVHSQIRQLGGSLSIDSQPGQGAAFGVRLPFTMAVTQAVFVRIGETSFAVPIASVRGVGRIGRDELRARLGDERPVYRYADEDYGIHDLGQLLGAASARAQDSLQMPLLLLRSGDMRAAICIDQVQGSREIVVKPVGPQVNSIPGIFGATIMGDGRVVVILDVAPLVRRQLALAAAGGAAPAASAPAEPRRVPLVMVVDDSITMRKVSGRVLERHNFEVATARDGVDAIEKLADRVPDLMLLDIEMPRMDGYELATHMKNDPRLRNIPIVMITSRTGDKHRQRAFEIGVDRYLGKPWQEADLVHHVYGLLGLEQAHG